MKFDTRKTVYTELKNYCHLAKPDDTVEVCEWSNGEGFDISFSDRTLSLTYGELQAIEVLTKVKHPKASQ